MSTRHCLDGILSCTLWKAPFIMFSKMVLLSQIGAANYKRFLFRTPITLKIIFTKSVMTQSTVCTIDNDETC